jgi:peptide deformylase
MMTQANPTKSEAQLIEPSLYPRKRNPGHAVPDAFSWGMENAFSLNDLPPSVPLDILTAPHPVLRQVARPVDFGQDRLQLEKWVAALGQTLDEHPNGVGLAAPQVGLSVRMVAIECSGRKTPAVVWINPVIKRRIGSKGSLEGCLSLPGERYSCNRAKRIEVEAFDIQGVRHLLRCDGLEAICFQHEIDHLNGILIEDGDKKSE